MYHPNRASGRFIIEDAESGAGHYEQDCVICGSIETVKELGSSCEVCFAHLCDRCFEECIGNCECCHTFICSLCGGARPYLSDEKDRRWYDKNLCPACISLLLKLLRERQVFP